MPPTSPISDSSRNESGRFASSRGHHLADMSLPPDQRKHLLEMDSSFRADSDPGNSTDFSEILSGTVFGRVGDMGPPPIPVNPPKRKLQRSASNISTRSSKSGRSISTSNRISKTREGIFADKPEQYLQSPVLPYHDPEDSSPDRTSFPSEDPDTLPSSPSVAAQTRNSSRSSALAHPFIPATRTDPNSGEIGLAIERRPSGRSSRDEGSRGGTHSTEVVKSSSASSRSARMSSSSTNHGNKRRPKFLKSRQSNSQRSSISSMTDMNPDFDNDGASTITAGGMGGGVLSRSTSLGSIASGVTGLAGSGGSIYSGDKPIISMSTAAERALARLDEEERNFRLNSTVSPNGSRGRQPSPGDFSSEPKTPTDQKPSLVPTDTVITAHVKSIHIPPTVTREYHSRNPPSPSKRPGATPVLAQGKNMTLKEQSFIIDRLQKENFDLKIKVFYLNEKLEKQSDEGIKEMMKENIDMKVKLAEGMRERKTLKKRIRELEKKIEEMGGEKEGEEEDGEIWELRERVERYEVEIEELTRNAEREKKMRDETEKGQPAGAGEDVVSERRSLWFSHSWSFLFFLAGHRIAKTPFYFLHFSIKTNINRKCSTNFSRQKLPAASKSMLRTAASARSSGASVMTPSPPTSLLTLPASPPCAAAVSVASAETARTAGTTDS